MRLPVSSERSESSLSAVRRSQAACGGSQCVLRLQWTADPRGADRRRWHAQQSARATVGIVMRVAAAVKRVQPPPLSRASSSESLPTERWRFARIVNIEDLLEGAWQVGPVATPGQPVLTRELSAEVPKRAPASRAVGGPQAYTKPALKIVPRTTLAALRVALCGSTRPRERSRPHGLALGLHCALHSVFIFGYPVDFTSPAPCSDIRCEGGPPAGLGQANDLHANLAQRG